MTDTAFLRHAETDADVLACFDVMQQLRPHLQSPGDFLARVSTQRAQGYCLLAVWEGGKPVALAGYRRVDNLIHGRFIYVDDLVTDEAGRGRGHGERLLAELGTLGRAENRERMVLDTGLANALAQRFYFRCGLLARGLHFSMDLS
ncbi:Ribosomal protein S18 acetylase RimI [Paraburkholderia sabiae]|uniref:GNAT family N-acetyltransferase n=1 Tax=Paraburkholderia sabiae TaxID=273251 RepID=UPI001CAF1CDF|nr:GNAT family N-acetyltransferase [Paraburkholderia sabiae]CAG9221479.1 Ribosomal protein S18 acetylase RimI [Paraburkholderia sabiae]